METMASLVIQINFRVKIILETYPKVTYGTYKRVHAIHVLRLYM